MEKGWGPYMDAPTDATPTIHLCFEGDIVPYGLTDDEREEIAHITAEYEAMMAQPRCPICGEGPQFFKNGECPYSNAEDHQQD